MHCGLSNKVDILNYIILEKSLYPIEYNFVWHQTDSILCHLIITVQHKTFVLNKAAVIFKLKAAILKMAAILNIKSTNKGFTKSMFYLNMCHFQVRFKNLMFFPIHALVFLISIHLYIFIDNTYSYHGNILKHKISHNVYKIKNISKDLIHVDN